jgi:hypothetical protein
MHLPVLFFYTHAIPIGYPCMPVSMVPRRNSAVREDIFSHASQVHYSYEWYGYNGSIVGII